MDGVVASGSGDSGLANALAETLGWKHLDLETRRFPDTEGYVRVPNDCLDPIRSGPVALVSTTFPDSAILETLFLLDAIRDVRSGEMSSLKGGEVKESDVGPGVFLVIPYYGYSRQDKRFMAGEAISAKFLARTFASHCDGIVVLDIHAPEAMENMGVPVELVSAMPEIAEHLRENVRPDFVLSPDKGAIERASSVANAIDVPFSYLEKKRIDAHTIEHTPKDLDVEGQVVAIVDDMISTGGSVVKATQFLKKQKCRRVFVACTHALLVNDAAKNIKNAGVSQIISTNTIPGESAKVDVSKVISDAFK